MLLRADSGRDAFARPPSVPAPAMTHAPTPLT
jgi:hypothetical protein